MSSITLPSFTLENGTTLHDVPVAYRTWGRLNAAADNAVLVCHALTGSANADDWWHGLIGPGCLLDPSEFFVICPNVIGSPYGTISPLTVNPGSGQPYGADFPEATIRDTVRLHRHLLDRLGVREVALAIGGSMGGMQVLEWAFEDDFVRALAPIAVGGRHSAWCIGWGEAQRQAINADPNWNDGRYDPAHPPTQGLAAARMMAMLSYRSFAEFADRFGRTRMAPNGSATPPFSVESYLRYQGQKLVQRFDANCYVHLTRQMDSHDVARRRGAYEDVLRQIEQPALVLGITTDVLYPLAEQEELTAHLPHAELGVIDAPYGHDAFLIAFDQLERLLRPWMDHHVHAAVSA